MARDKTSQMPWLTLWPACLLKLTFITLAFKGVRTSYLVNMCLQVMTINGIPCWYGNVVTMATEAYILNFALTSYLVHRSLEPTVFCSQLVAMNYLFPWQHRHTILGSLSEGMPTSYLVHKLFLETMAIVVSSHCFW